MANSNFPPGYSEDGDACTHGRDTAMYHDLLDIRERYRKWKEKYRDEFYNDEMLKQADAADDAMSELSDAINQTL